jgi:membrane fusion protein (multidrug efflux system)
MNTSTTTSTSAAPAAAHADEKPRTAKRLIIVLTVLAVLAALLIGFHLFKAGILKKVTAGIQSQQPTVATVPASVQPWQSSLTAVGSLRATNGADLSPEIGGVIEEIRFKSGENVAAGTVLVRLRLNDDAAKLQQLQATAAVDEITYKRDLLQLKAQGVSQSTVDTDAANLKVARAQVAAQQAVIDEKTIRAPFAGKLGLRQVDIGQYVSAGTTLVTLQALDPMLLDFYLPQQALSQVAEGQPVVVNVDAYPGKKFTGNIASLNAKVDATSRMLQIRAAVDNHGGALLPGMFASVSVAHDAPQSLVTIPQAAVAYNPYGSLVYVIHDSTDANGKPQKIAHQQFVTTGATRGDQVSILKGIDAHDVVVTAGQLKLHNDAPVQIDNSVKLTDDIAPVPADH